MSCIVGGEGRIAVGLPSGDLYSDSVGSPLDAVAGGVCYSCRRIVLPCMNASVGHMKDPKY